jgi:hypothetical protein
LQQTHRVAAESRTSKRDLYLVNSPSGNGVLS